MTAQDLFNQYFLEPAMNPGVQGYNLVNTAVYGALLVLLAFFVIYPFLDKKKIKFNYRFALAMIPFILIGTALRAINSARLLPGVSKTLNPFELGFWTFTPGVWFATFGLVIIGMIVAWRVEKKTKMEFSKALGIIGIIFALVPVLFVLSNFSNWNGFVLVSLLVIAVSGAIAIALKKIKATERLATKMNLLAVAGQVMDSSATVFAVFTLNFTEQHPLSDAILKIPVVGPLAFLALKLVLVLVILNFVEKEIKRENLRSFIKLFIIILGFATGLASVLKIGLV